MELGDAKALVQALARGLAREPDPEALDALYRSLPRMECKGRCASACGPVPLSPLERQRIRERGFPWVDGRVVTLPLGQKGGTTCSALDVEGGRCRIYEDRPLICRIWGVVKSLECPWGCVPEGGHLDDTEGLRLVNLSLWYGGSPLAIEPGRYDELAAHPARRRAAAEFLARSRPVKEELRVIQTTIPVRSAG
ncbi:hypothetical protein DMB38_20610 [Streptomyces sp. WAC 06738]|uniref:YkgJ family cysteine cluster protein n=1 Tax=Streptomyces sp. WAC 06738 TaxID=2203210 RepID=UPI000F7133C4|nr:YkgJ family cysteine cluster protein [Streptomyces sp. WAC 06738]AZM47873.1 hypothetical protein DMB38_20610 [Streptomyces sp. WAC 06738]